MKDSCDHRRKGARKEKQATVHGDTQFASEQEIGREKGEQQQSHANE